MLYYDIKIYKMYVDSFLKLLFYSGEKWRKRFYWNVDSLSSPDGNRLRQLEEQVFRSQKRSILKEMKQKWNGSREQNSIADSKISEIVKKALLCD